MKYKITFIKAETTETVHEVTIETDKPIHGANKSALRHSFNAAFNSISDEELTQAPIVAGGQVPETEVTYTPMKFEEVSA